jgi:hypothetical protein
VLFGNEFAPEKELPGDSFSPKSRVNRKDPQLENFVDVVLAEEIGGLINAV